jgi:DNA-binding protein YbaB
VKEIGEGQGVADFGTDGDRLERILSAAESGMPEIGKLRERITEIVGKGEAAEGRITAEYTSEVGLSALELDPRTLRLPVAELSQAIKDAVNAAAEDFRAQVTGVGGALFASGGTTANPLDPAAARPFQDPSAALAQVEQMGNAFAGQMKDLLRELGAQQRRAQQAAESYRRLGEAPS